MKLVLLRHATRAGFSSGASGGEIPLTAVGLAQAEDLIGYLTPKGPLPTPTRIMASPRLRARQTLTPLSKELAVELEIEPRLDERHSDESASAFQQRMKSLFDDLCLKKSHTDQEVVYLCTHMDWLEAVSSAWPTDLSEREASTPWTPLEFQVFRLSEDHTLSAIYRGRVNPRF